MGQDGRLTAPVKPDGGVRGTVVGDILRRLVARTTAQQVSTEAEAATALFQYAPSTRAGCECVAYFMGALTDFNPEATVVSIDATGAHDIISRNAVLEGLLQVENGDQVLPFMRNFYGQRRWAPYTRSSRRKGRRPDVVVVQTTPGIRGHPSQAAVGGEQREWEMSTRSCMKSSGRVPGSGCVKAGHRCGTEEVPVRPGPTH